MSIHFACACGKQFTVKDEMAGKRTRCPACGAGLTVPQEAIPFAEEVPAPAPPADPEPDAAPTPRKKRRPKPEREEAPPSRLPLVLAAGGGAAVVLGAVAVGIWLFRPAPDTTPPTPTPQVAAADPVKPPEPRPAVTPTPTAEPKTATPALPAPVNPPPKPAENPTPPPPPPAVGPIAVRLVRFGPARIDDALFTGRTLTGAVVEIEATREAPARFEASSVTAADAAGKASPAEVLFVAAGRDGLGPTAKLLANTSGRAVDVLIGKSRFAPAPMPPALRGLRDASCKEPTTAKVNPTWGPVIQVDDVILALPLHLAKGGGVEYTTLPGRKVQVGAVFAAAPDALAAVTLLGQTIPLDRARRDDGPFPAAVARNDPAPPPRNPLLPAMPAGDPADAGGPEEDSGIWAVKADGTNQRLLLSDTNTYAVAVSRDLKMAAAFRMPGGGDDAGAAPGKPGVAAGDHLAIGPVGKPLRPIWAAPSTPAGGVNSAIAWSPAGSRVLVAQFNALSVVDLKGKPRTFGTATGLRQPGVIGIGMFDTRNAHWAGRGEAEVTVVTRGPTQTLSALNTVTGAQRDLCPLPGRFGMPTFATSDDLRTVAFAVRALGGIDLEGTGGVWVWRRGQAAPIRLVDGSAAAVAVSPDGRYVAATRAEEKRGQFTLFVHDLTAKKQLWSADGGGPGLAFDPAGKRLAVATIGPYQLLVTPVDRFEPTVLATSQRYPLEAPAWSADGKEVVFTRKPPPRPVRIIP